MFKDGPKGRVFDGREGSGERRTLFLVVYFS